MTTFEGPVKSIPRSPGVVFELLSDFNNLEPMLPLDKISGWYCTGDTCRFKFDGIGEIGLRIAEKDAPCMVKYASDGNTPVDFFLWVQLKEVAPSDTKIKLTLKADLNPMMKMVVTGPVNKFLDVLTNAIATYQYKS